MNLAALDTAITLLSPHVAAVALCSIRILPATFLCPLLGGQTAPSTVKLALCLSLAIALHVEAGISVPASAMGVWSLVALAGGEMCLGLAIGLVAALPFDAARIGGRFIDLFRGTSAEASLPVAGTKEAVTGDGLHQLLVALACAVGAVPLAVSALWRSFGVIPIGAGRVTEATARLLAQSVGGAVAVGLAIGAPVAAAALCVDLLLGLASRTGGVLDLRELAAPLRILGGGAVLWLGVGLICDRLLAEVLGSPEGIGALLEVSR